MSDSQSRIEELLNTLITDGSTDLVPQTEVEMYLKACIDKTGTSGLPEPTSRMTLQLKELADELAGGGGGGGGSANLLQSSVTANRQANVTYGDMVNLGYALGLEEGKMYTVKYKFNGTDIVATAKYEQPVESNFTCLVQRVTFEGEEANSAMIIGVSSYALTYEEATNAVATYGMIYIVDKHQIVGDMEYSTDANNASVYIRALQSSQAQNAVSVEITSIEEVVE